MKTSRFETIRLDEEIKYAVQKVAANLMPFSNSFPDDMTIHGVYPKRKSYQGYPDGANIGWTSGFWPGMIWLAFELDGDERFRQSGEHHVLSFLERIEKKQDVDIHDLGFMYTLSCVSAWKLTGNLQARRAALLAADHLMTRFLDKPGIFQAWGSIDDKNEHGRTIIDSLMNMPLLYWASQETCQLHYKAAACRHAIQLRDHFIRPDHTTFHTYFFDVESGWGLRGETAQGYAHQSCWARGQAWGIYGFALNYLYTGEASFLEAACQLADYFLENLPQDKVVYWDLVFKNNSAEERDSSAAVIAVCGLMEIARHLPEGELHNRYQREAVAMLASLAENYTSRDLPQSNALLLHAVGSKPHGVGVDEACLWGDYFYMEALTRLAKPDWKLYW